MKYKALTLYLTLSMGLIGCEKPPPPPYVHIPALPAKLNNTNSIRLQAIQDTSLSIGAQGGLAWQANNINEALLQEQQYLDRIFNFNQLILNNNVLPPVLAEGNQALNIADPETLRLADKIYKIVLPPRFVTAPPTWRDYLWLNYQKPDAPNVTLLPKNEQERIIWNRYIKTGWIAGVEQANDIFSANLGRLKRDYDGMILYRSLLAQNIVTPPFVAKVNLGITGDNNNLRINDQVLRITATSKLNPNAKTWKAVVRPGEAGGEDTDADEAAP